MSGGIQIEFDASDLIKFEQVFRKIGNQAPHAIRRALNHTGDKARTQVARQLVKQTGATYGAVRAALNSRPASYGNLRYEIVARGSAISLKHFSARQTKPGVTAAPWNMRRVFPHTFIVKKLGGHVFVRTSRKRFPIKKLWGPAIPNELVRGHTPIVFNATVQAELPSRLAHEIGAIMSGAAPRG